MTHINMKSAVSSPPQTGVSTAAGSRSSSRLRILVLPFPPIDMRHVRRDSDFTQRSRRSPRSPPMSRPASTVRSRDFLETADTLISTCRLHLRTKSNVHRDLSRKLQDIKSEVQSIIAVGSGNKRRFNTGRRQYLEEQQFTREQMTRMLKVVRIEFKKAYRVL